VIRGAGDAASRAVEGDGDGHRTGFCVSAAP
jgi:hypothetical protein